MPGRGRGSLLSLFLFTLPAFAQTLPEQVALCEACHGKGGNSPIAGTPSIAAQPRTFLENQLVYFREELRNAPVMQGVAKGMKDENITALAKHFSEQAARVVATGPADKALSARGSELAAKMHCGECHLPRYQGRAQMPRIAGQREEYMVDTMIAYRDNKRTGADTTMSEVLYGMSDADIRALAHYLARLE
jgi:cytochrome c553